MERHPMMKTLSIGKIYGLQQLSTPHRAFSICALDHRNNLRHLLYPTKPEQAPITELVKFKMELIQALAPAASAVLLDPEWSAGQCIATNTLPRETGMIVAVEATGYLGHMNTRQSRLLPNWSVAKVKRMGGNAVKLLVYYHPDSPTSHMVEELVCTVATDCIKQDIPFFLEPLSYSLDPVEKQLKPKDRRRIVVETAHRLSSLGADVLKAEFPLDITNQSNEREWRAACEELTQASQIPWVLLSASVDFETFLRQVVVAAQAGASGVAVGRAVWKEATEFSGQDRVNFLSGIARSRMESITASVDALTRPWTDCYQASPVTPDWYASYSE
jgi:tagatose-1,6-bisphosphate aldolase